MTKSGDVYEKLVFCEPKQYLYEIIDGRKLTVVNNQKSLGFRKNEIKGDNVIKNKQLNKILNDIIAKTKCAFFQNEMCIFCVFFAVSQLVLNVLLNGF